MALFGMNMLMLYTEDTYEVKEYPLFGYQRGRYTEEELRELDDYAASLGIEIIPCIQTFGHLRQFLRYKENSVIKENESVLLPGEERTYEFIEACIATCRRAFRSGRIHIGCDETRGLGFGASFKRDGLRDRFEIFNEHITRVVAICKKYELPVEMTVYMFEPIRKSCPGRQGYRLDPQRMAIALEKLDRYRMEEKDMIARSIFAYRALELYDPKNMSDELMPLSCRAATSTACVCWDGKMNGCVNMPKTRADVWCRMRSIKPSTPSS